MKNPAQEGINALQKEFAIARKVSIQLEKMNEEIMAMVMDHVCDLGFDEIDAKSFNAQGFLLEAMEMYLDKNGGGN